MYDKFRCNEIFRHSGKCMYNFLYRKKLNEYRKKLNEFYR